MDSLRKVVPHAQWVSTTVIPSYSKPRRNKLYTARSQGSLPHRSTMSINESQLQRANIWIVAFCIMKCGVACKSLSILISNKMVVVIKDLE